MDFGKLDPKAFHPKIGSTKGNFGHTLVAAGFAGATKVLLSMNKGVIPATPKLTRPMMPHVLVENCPWPDCSNNGGLKRAGLSAFGFGGTQTRPAVATLLAARSLHRRAASPNRR